MAALFFFDEFQHLKIQLEEIHSATDNFADNKVIGNGGFGKVYKGEISHSKGRSMVAFKRLDSRFGQGNSEFWKEITMLSRYTHENLVSLLGFCDEAAEKILVYEYASRGSLDHYLSATTLTWMQRLKICLGVAKGLSYLHDPMGTQQRVIHRDIKSSNILLDDNWNAKVSDFGLSKIGPANQNHSAVVSNVVGTPGYLDPLYYEYGVLSKESDVYSFGVVLFETLCGRLCYEYNNGRCESLVRLWKQKYEQNKLDEIIFQDLVEQVDASSLETFSEIAYQCLQKSRPPMAHVVEKLKIALQFHEIYQVMELPKEYSAIIKTTVIPGNFRSEEELMRLLSKGILVNSGKTWFTRNKNGKHCELISARECMNPSADEYMSEENSRFVQGNYVASGERFKAHAMARFLSRGIMYTVNLVFKFLRGKNSHIDRRDPIRFHFKYQLGEETESSVSYLAYGRENGWMMVELYQFTSDSTSFDLDIRFESLIDGARSIIVEGIEFRPRKNVEHQVLEDEKVDMQPTSDSDVYWEQKLPNDYKQIIKWSKDTTKWSTKKELYHLFCKGFLISKRKGFLINSYKEWFSLSKHGQKCLMLPARATLVKSDWKWKPLPTSRFKEVALNFVAPFSIICKIESQMLSRETTYACYLVYKITKNDSKFVPPMLVVDIKGTDLPYLYDPFTSWYIYLLGPLTRVINPKDGQNTHNPSDIPKVNGLPQLRNDGWMEVQVRRFRTTKMTSMRFELTISDGNTFEPLDGLIVQGIEFKPL